MALEAKYGDLHSLRIDRTQKEPEEPKWSKRFILAGIGLVVLLGIVVLAARLLSSSIPEVQTVRAKPVTSSSNSGDTVLQAAGYIVAHHTISVNSKVTGRIAWIGVEKGDKVKAGQVLVRLEDQEFRAQAEQARGAVSMARARLQQLENGSRPEEIDQANANLDEARANLANAKATLERTKPLVQQGVFSRQQLDDAQAKYDSAQQRVQSLEKAYRLSKIGPRQEEIANARGALEFRLKVDVPRVVMAHGDLITWTQSVEGYTPQPTRWLKWYRNVVTRGLAAADAVVAPSRWMLDALRQSYTRAQREEVIYPGRNPIFFNPYVDKEDSVLAVGRLIDAGKQVFLLTQHAHPVSVCIVGAEHTVPMPRIPIRADVKVSTDQTCVAIRGPQTEAQLRSLYSRASIYAATARYEPLGITALEAALSRCAIVANDIPSFREIWGDAALYFRTNDASSLAESIRRLNADREMRRAYANLAYARARERFTTKRMIDEYLQLYRSLVSVHSAAA